MRCADACLGAHARFGVGARTHLQFVLQAGSKRCGANSRPGRLPDSLRRKSGSERAQLHSLPKKLAVLKRRGFKGCEKPDTCKAL
jgi:hypothetical protein